MDDTQLISTAIPLMGLRWIMDCAYFELCGLDEPEEGSEEEAQQAAAWEAIRIIEEALTDKVVAI